MILIKRVKDWNDHCAKVPAIAKNVSYCNIVTICRHKRQKNKTKLT